MPGDREIRLVVSVNVEEDNWLPVRSGITVDNIRELEGLDRVFDRLGIRPTYFTTYQVIRSDVGARVIRELAGTGRVEIGAHLHPWNTPPMDEPLGSRALMLGNLPPALQRAKLDTLTSLLADRLGAAPVSFRAGRFALRRATARALVDAGYWVDSSVTPFIDWSLSDGGANFVPAPVRVYRCDPEAGVTLERMAGPIIEVPVSSGFSRFRVTGWPALHRVLSCRAATALQLPGIASRVGYVHRIVLTPEQIPLRQALALSRRLISSGVLHLHLVMHSSSLRPGLNPYVRTRADVDRLYSRVEEYVENLSMIATIRFSTVTEAAIALDPAVGTAPRATVRPEARGSSAIHASAQKDRRPRLLVVTYHFPPDGAVGGLRWAGFTKYLERRDWDVRVLTAAEGRAGYVSDGVVVESCAPGSTLGSFYRRHFHWVRSRKGDRTTRPTDADVRSSRWWSLIRAEVAALMGLPDQARGWIWPAARRLRSLVREFRPDVVVSTGPPHSAHIAVLLGLWGTRRPWVLDFRDPWAGVIGQRWGPGMLRTAVAQAVIPWFEGLTIRRASAVVLNTPELADVFLRAYPTAVVRWVPNGVDLERLEIGAVEPYPGLSIAYVGTLYLGRDPMPVLRALAAFLERHPAARAAARFRLAGDVELEHLARLNTGIDELGLRGHVEHLGVLEPEDALALLRRSRVGVVLAQEQGLQIPAKLYELLGLGVTTLAVTEKGSATAREAIRLGATCVSPDDVEAIVGAFEAAHEAGWLRRDPGLLGIGYDRITERVQKVLLTAAPRIKDIGFGYDE